MSSARVVVVAVLVAAATAIASGARAHLGHEVMGAERYLKVDASAHELRVVVSLSLGPASGEQVLRAADGDSNGSVTRAEADAYLRQWTDALATELPVEIAGERVRLSFRDKYFEPIGDVAAVPLTVEVVGYAPLSPGRQLVTLVDRMSFGGLDRTDVAFRAHEGVVIEASGVGRAPGRPEPDVVLLTRRAGLELSAKLRVPGTPQKPSSSHTLAIALVAAVALLLVVAWRVARARGISR